MTISAPTDISGCRVWLDADDAGTFTFSGGTNVSQWNDKSGNAEHYADFTGGAAFATRNGSQNGKTTVVFAAGSAFGGHDVGISESQPVSVFLVAKVTATTWSGVFRGGDGTAQIQMQRSGADNTKVMFTAGTDQLVAIDSTNYHIIGGIFNGASSSQRLDGVQVSTLDCGTGGLTKYILGADWGLNRNGIEYAEVVIYDVAVSGTDLTDLEDYFDAKWFGAAAFDPPELQHPPFQQNVYRM